MHPVHAYGLRRTESLPYIASKGPFRFLPRLRTHRYFTLFFSVFPVGQNAYNDEVEVIKEPPMLSVDDDKLSALTSQPICPRHSTLLYLVRPQHFPDYSDSPPILVRSCGDLLVRCVPGCCGQRQIENQHGIFNYGGNSLHSP